MASKGAKKGKGLLGRFQAAISKGSKLGKNSLSQKGRKGDFKGAGAKSGKKSGKGSVSGPKGAKLDVGDLPIERQEELKAGVEAFLESDESSWSLAAELTGLERKFIHQVAEEKGLSSQSFGFGADRYITLFKPGGDDLALEEGDDVAEPEVDPDTIQFSGIKIDADSRKQLLCGLVDIPAGWRMKAQVSLLCKGGLANPLHDRRDIRSEMDHVKDNLKKLHPHQTVSFKIVSVGRSDTSVAVGILLPKEVTCTQRTPHITVAKAPDAPAMIASRSVDVMAWDPLDGPTIHGEIIQVPKGADYVEPAGEHFRKRLDTENIASDAKRPFANGQFGKGRLIGSSNAARPCIGNAPPTVATRSTVQRANITRPSLQHTLKVAPSPAKAPSVKAPSPAKAATEDDDLLAMLSSGPANARRSAHKVKSAGGDSVDDFLALLCETKPSVRPSAVKTPPAVQKPVGKMLAGGKPSEKKPMTQKSVDEELLLLCDFTSRGSL